MILNKSQQLNKLLAIDKVNTVNDTIAFTLVLKKLDSDSVGELNKSLLRYDELTTYSHLQSFPYLSIRMRYWR